MRILITGSQGTLGQPLFFNLTAMGYETYGIDLFHVLQDNYTRCDTTNYRKLYEVIDEFKPDLVYHTAAEFGRINGEEYYENVWKSNVIGTRNLLEIQRLLPFRLVMFSSSEIYGDVKAEWLTENATSVQPANDYAVSKLVNEIQCKNFRKKYGNKIMILRLFNAYGEGEYYHKYRSVVCLFCYRALFGLPYTVYKNYYRVFMYIDDLMETLLKIPVRFKDGITVNIGGQEYRSVEELSNIIQKETQGKNKITYLPEDKHNITNKRPSIEKAKKLFGHNPTTPLEVGIKRTLEWMKKVYK